jgi:molybdopterin-biosynthesis enzyme MoeA-like protein
VFQDFALFPHQAEIIPNPLGTAPGFILRETGKIYVKELDMCLPDNPEIIDDAKI